MVGGPSVHVPSVEERLMCLEQGVALVALLSYALSIANHAGRDVSLGHRSDSVAWAGVQRRCEEVDEHVRAIHAALSVADLGQPAPLPPVEGGE